MPKIYITCDHAGFNLKNQLIKELIKVNILLTDLVNIFDKDDDYTDNAKLLAFEIKNDIDLGQHSVGIAICGSGQGICIALNRFAFIRASQPRTSLESIKTREHNNSNIICFGSNTMPVNELVEIIQVFVISPFCQDLRHQRRIDKMTDESYIKI